MNEYKAILYLHLYISVKIFRQLHRFSNAVVLVQWNLSITVTLGQDKLTVIERVEWLLQHVLS